MTETLSGEEEPGPPRFFPEPHPMAVGTSGGALAMYAEDIIGEALLPWQRTVADRMLEFDRDGRWCRPTALLLVPRQSGKSTLVRALCEWLASTGQFVICTSLKLVNVRHLMMPSLTRYRDVPDAKVSHWINQPELAVPGWTERTHRWIGQAANSQLGRGFTCDTVVIDEVQDVEPVALESVTPTLTEVPNPLVLMTGTAPRADSTQLLAEQRKIALDGGPVALFEWSAPREADWRDEETWRAASPRWTPSRLRRIRAACGAEGESYVRSEFLCQSTGGAGAEPWLDLRLWTDSREALDVPASVEVAAVEDGRGGQGGCVGLAWHDAQHVCVVAVSTPDLPEAWEWAARAERVLCGITLRNEDAARDLSAQPRGRRETATALPELRRLLASGLLRWDGDDLDAQARSVPVREDSTGALAVDRGMPSGVLRAAAWAVQAVRLEREPVLV